MDQSKPLTDRQIREHTVGELEPLDAKIHVTAYDPEWPEIFRREAARIAGTLGQAALRVEHVGSTSVPGLSAKPIVDVLLVVHDSADEAQYVPALTDVGYALRIREPEWHQHRMLVKADPGINVHVFSVGCPEIDRVLLFRDRLRNNPADRDLYSHAKLELAKRPWRYVQNYADAKTAIVEEILQRATAAQGS